MRLILSFFFFLLFHIEVNAHEIIIKNIEASIVLRKFFIAIICAIICGIFLFFILKFVNFISSVINLKKTSNDNLININNNCSNNLPLDSNGVDNNSYVENQLLAQNYVQNLALKKTVLNFINNTKNVN